MESYKREFIKFLEGAGVLKFGDFTAKSGKIFEDEFIEVSKTKIKIKLADLLTYNTKFLGNYYKKLDNVKTTKV